MNFYTIGVYNSTEEIFFEKLLTNRIDLFCDIRERRGVRGKKYSFVNSKRLQQKLAELNISYSHIKKLTPTREIRDKQKYEDIRQNILKRDRTILGDKFVLEYKVCILDFFDFNALISEFKSKKYKNIVFFCVEERAEACHRSLVAERLKDNFAYTIKDL